MRIVILGTILLVAALLALLAALGASIGDLTAHGNAARREMAQRASLIGLGLMLLALLLLAGAFLVGDLSVFYVWRYVDLRYDWYQRLSGLWIGREGSLLLWTVMALSFWAIDELRHRHVLRRSQRIAVANAVSANPPRGAGTTQEPDDQRLAETEAVRRWARTLILGLTSAMLLTVLVQDLFAATPASSLQDSPYGRGVNPQLIIAFNAIHPPIVFVGYALCALITAFAVGHLATGHNTWLGPARRWAHVAFLFLTLGVGLGGLWAYIALGWGGYWAWDPVEVGSIVPWIAVTAFLHAAYRADSHGEFALAAPLLGFLALPAALISTFIVRAGGVWVSVHSFIGPGDASSPWGRFLTALDTQPEVKLYTTLLVIATIALVVFALRHIARLERIDATRTAATDHAQPTTPDAMDTAADPPEAATHRADDADATAAPDTSPHASTNPTGTHTPPRTYLTPWQRLLQLTNLRNAFLLGVILLALLGTVTVTILFQRIDGFPSDAVRAAVYTERTGPIALTAVLVMGLAIGLGALRKAYVLALLGGALLIGAIGALSFPGVRALAMAVPMLAAVAVIAATRIVLAWRHMPRRGAIRFSGIHMVHLGVATLLLGHGFVSTYETFEAPIELTPGETRAVGPYLLRLDSLHTSDTDENGRTDHIDARIRVWQGDTELGVIHTGFQYYDFQSHYKPEVGIARLIGKDVYLAPQAVRDPSQGWLFGNLPLFEQNAFEADEIDAISVQVSTLPYINLVWGGAGLMVLGAALLSYSSWNAHRPSPTPGTARQGAPAAA